MKNALLFICTFFLVGSVMGSPNRFDGLDEERKGYVVSLLAEGLLIGCPAFVQFPELSAPEPERDIPKTVSVALGLKHLVQLADVFDPAIPFRQVYVYHDSANLDAPLFPPFVFQQYRFPQYIPTLYSLPSQTMFAVLVPTNALDIAFLNPRLGNFGSFKTIFEDAKTKSTDRFFEGLKIDVSVTNRLFHVFPGCIFDVNGSGDTTLEKTLETLQNIELSREELSDILFAAFAVKRIPKARYAERCASLSEYVSETDQPKTALGTMLLARLRLQELAEEFDFSLTNAEMEALRSDGRWPGEPEERKIRKSRHE